MDSHIAPSSSSSSSRLTTTLHPLPVLNISDHHTRTRLQHRSDNYKIVGALIGIQKGNEVEIVNSFELALVGDQLENSGMEIDGERAPGGDKVEVDWAFFEERTASFKQVFPTLDLIGWYSVGNTPSPIDRILHTQFQARVESALFLQLDTLSPQLSSDSSSSEQDNKEQDLPVDLYQTVHLAGAASATTAEGPTLAKEHDSQKTWSFEKISWRIKTGEAERIAVEGIGKAGPDLLGDTGGTSLMVPVRNALQKLSNRTQLIVSYLDGCLRGDLRVDQEVLREIESLLGGLPVDGGHAFREEFDMECADTMLTNYLSALTKSLHAMNSTTDKFTFLHTSSHERGPGGISSVGGLNSTDGSSARRSVGSRKKV
ncbi:COP9 signalosome, subunit CSN6 [Phaffia rhodozyma]|uniref:COP9 signalosome complex subunit 6 n=1 Tax=Phaffia rhodozyma TaxID=264483 RepID=A0A0F7SXN4_PHARH|nr:COP9 signalosome, subunit CSN6 [Phaffia rhodozyma]